ncbi:hypothetical protein C7431_102236 [Pantoea allii]|uniref:Uncharacterized protein n=1 Tax=Pantoea allii TaxID=574096 RepID=A0A2V2BNU8_9GAMM|nr:hypothetical protein C7431_102236 [Pantoea allii]
MELLSIIDKEISILMPNEIAVCVDIIFTGISCKQLESLMVLQIYLNHFS